MEKYVINGGKKLQGEVEISGAKNAAVAIIPAALLIDGVCCIENMPQISDTDMLLTILKELGAGGSNPDSIGNILSDLLGEYMDDVLTGDGVAPNGFISFFQKIINWFNSIIEWFKNLFR